MSGQWGAVLGGIVGRRLTGVGTFRMMPTDDFASGAASAAAAAHADGYALDVSYTWTHPQDGPQDGVLLVGSPSEEAGGSGGSGEQGQIEATWLDSWHCKPTPMHFTGRREQGTVTLETTYAGSWGWHIVLELDPAAGMRIVMRNVVPPQVAEGKDDPQAFSGPYDVMVLDLS